jgi:CheY-like chemotaxis protein
VDDNVDAARSMAMLIETQGHTVRVAHDGEAAIDLAVAFAPQAVLLDIGLPKLDGYAVAERLRSALPGKFLLIAITGYGQGSDRERASAAGFDHHLTKPVDFSAIEELLRTGRQSML